MRAAAAGLCHSRHKAAVSSSQSSTPVPCGCAVGRRYVTLSRALAGEIRLEPELQMVASADGRTCCKNASRLFGGGHGRAVQFGGGAGRMLAGDGPEYGKVLHFDVPCQEPPDPAQVPEHTADKGGRIMSEQVEGGLDTLRNMERQSAGFWMLSGKFSSGGWRRRPLPQRKLAGLRSRGCGWCRLSVRRLAGLCSWRSPPTSQISSCGRREWRILL